MNTSICLIGCGSTFESIAADPAGYGLADGWFARQVESVAALSSSVPDLLDGLSATKNQIFIAVDQSALNYARLEFYGAARLRGFQMSKLIHESATIAPDTRIDDNVWIGAGVLVSSKVHIASNVLVSPGVRLDAGSRIGAHGWVGPGASVGAAVQIGSHCVIGADMRIREGIQIGKNCVLDTARMWSQDMPDGSFIAPQFDSPAQLIGAGYSFVKARS